MTSWTRRGCSTRRPSGPTRMTPSGSSSARSRRTLVLGRSNRACCVCSSTALAAPPAPYSPEATARLCLHAHQSARPSGLLPCRTRPGPSCAPPQCRAPSGRGVGASVSAGAADRPLAAEGSRPGDRPAAYLSHRRSARPLSIFPSWVIISACPPDRPGVWRWPPVIAARPVGSPPHRDHADDHGG